MTIGEVAERAHVATSTIRYYERCGLLAADARESGQRRFRQATLRRLVFIGMLQDAGLALDDIAGILGAEHVAEWKVIARRRLDVLDEEIERLTPSPRIPGGRAAVPLRPPGHRVQDHGRRDRPPPRPVGSVVGGSWDRRPYIGPAVAPYGRRENDRRCGDE